LKTGFFNCPPPPRSPDQAPQALDTVGVGAHRWRPWVPQGRWIPLRAPQPGPSRASPGRVARGSGYETTKGCRDRRSDMLR